MVKTLSSIGIGGENPCFIIAEAGVNHNGDLATARDLVRAARHSGADCVKFQTFSAERVVTRGARKAAYQLEVTDREESQFEMLRRLELSEEAHRELMALCSDEGIAFMSTPYNFEDAELLSALDVPAFKLASMHITEIPFLRFVARMGKPMIISTGMANMTEVAGAVTAVREAGNPEIVVLQCTTNYPASPAEANLRAMRAMGDQLQVEVGYSDHTEGIVVPIAAVALGARVIEKHITLDQSLPGPDQRSSSDPEVFRQLVGAIRDVESALGSAVKKPTSSEIQNRTGMRRSIVATTRITAGTVITQQNLTFKRPATGLSPTQLDSIIGKTARRDIEPDVPLAPSDLVEL